MDYKDELKRVFDECIVEIFEGEELSEDERLDIDLIKEALVAESVDNKLSEEEQDYIINNIDLYKRFFKAVLTENEKETKKALLEMLQIKNNTKI